MSKFKISNNGETKYILRKILKKYMPIEIINRPKQGFTPPINEWLNGFLKDEIFEIKNDLFFFEVGVPTQINIISEDFTALLKSHVNFNLFDK